MLKYNLKDLTKAYENGIVNKAYQGVTSSVTWSEYDSSLTPYGLKMKSNDYIQYTRKHDGSPVMLSVGGNSLQFARGWDADVGYYVRLYKIGGTEVKRWFPDETIEVTYDEPISIYNLDVYTQEYEAELAVIGNKGRVIYKRVRTPMYRKTSGETYCVGFDKMVEEYSQVSFDDGQTWTTTATTEVLVEHNSEDCGYQKPSIKSVYETTWTLVSDSDGNLSHIGHTAQGESSLAQRCFIQVKGITSITFKITNSVDYSGLRFYSSKDNYQTGTTVKNVGGTWKLGDLDPSLTYGIQVQLIRRDAQYITGTNCGADITYTTLE